MSLNIKNSNRSKKFPRRRKSNSNLPTNSKNPEIVRIGFGLNSMWRAFMHAHQRVESLPRPRHSSLTPLRNATHAHRPAHCRALSKRGWNLSASIPQASFFEVKALSRSASRDPKQRSCVRQAADCHSQPQTLSHGHSRFSLNLSCLMSAEKSTPFAKPAPSSCRSAFCAQLCGH